MTTGILYRLPTEHPSAQDAYQRLCKQRHAYRNGNLDPRAAVLSFSILAVHPNERVRKLARLSLDEVAIEDAADLFSDGVLAR